MRNPAKHTAGLGFLLPKKGEPNCFALGNKGGFDWDTVGDVFYFFCDQNRRFLCGDGGSMPGPHPLWLTSSAKVLMIVVKNLIINSKET